MRPCQLLVEKADQSRLKNPMRRDRSKGYRGEQAVSTLHDSVEPGQSSGAVQQLFFGDNPLEIFKSRS